MAAATRNAVTKIDWQKLSAVTATLSKDTASSLQAFKKRHDELRRSTQLLEDSIPTIDFASYRSILKNQDIVAKSEKTLNEFKAVSVPLKEQLAALDKFEKKAVEKAKATIERVNFELTDLKETLTNIESTRPIDQLTVEDVVKAYPPTVKAVENLISRGRISVPGYYKKFGSQSIM